MALITTAEYKAYAGLTVDTFDARIGVVVSAVDSLVKSYCNRFFEQATYTERHDHGFDTLFLREAPVASVTAVKIVGAGSAYTVDPAAYTLDAGRGKLCRTVGAMGFAGDVFAGGGRPWDDGNPSWPGAPWAVEVEYVGGYQVTPASLAMACYQLVDAYMSTTRQDLVFNGAQVVGSLQKTLRQPGQASAAIREILETWIAREYA